MDLNAMQPHGLALLAFQNGDKNAQVLVRRDDGNVGPLPASHFFRRPDEFTQIEKLALENCRGGILDVGAGSGSHSLVLQQSGQTVAAIDISPQAVAVMQERGVTAVEHADIFTYKNKSFDTILMLGHGIGMVETIAGLGRFLAYAPNLLNPGGQILLDSLDVRHTNDPQNLAYQEANRQAGRYIGEIRIQFEYQGLVGPFCGWLHVDAQTLAFHAKDLGWHCSVLLQENNGDYLAQLTRADTDT